MGLLDMLKRPKSKPVPAAAAAARPGPRPVAPPYQRALIDTQDFQAAEPWRANEEITLAVWKVPEDSAFVIRPGSNLKFYLRTKATSTGYDNSAGGSAYTLTVSTPGIVQTKMRAPTLPSTRHPEVLAYADKGSGFVAVPVQAIDYNAGTVSLSVPVGENWTAVKVYYVSAQGEFKFVIVREGGGIRSEIPLYNNSFSAVHTVNQHDREERPTIANTGLLVEGYQLALKVTSPLEIEWSDEARHFVQLESLAISIPGADKDTLRRRAELLMRGGL